jgi:phospho-N-acetylmuramoyl-pentapeptide-transferase
MLYYLHYLDWFFFPFNVFQYQTFRGISAGITAFLISILFGPKVIRSLLSLKVGQPIRSKEEIHKLHELHGGKMGTPTMGGVLIIGAVVIATLLWARLENLYVQLAVLTIVYLGAVGFADDYMKVRRKKSDGMSGRGKLMLQFGLAAIVGLILLFHPATAKTAGALFVPFLKEPLLLNMGLAALLFYALVMLGSSNAVNLTDGLDGLAAGCTVTTAGAFAVLTYLAGNFYSAEYLQIPYNRLNAELSIFCCALAGAALGFLWFNCHPAKVFMGDTGSLAIGGTLGLIAICCKQEILLAVIGGVFVIEALSVIVQVMSFKLTGKRVLLMSPIHHHFELLGWKENTVIVRFWIISAILAATGLATLKLR